MLQFNTFFKKLSVGAVFLVFFLLTSPIIYSQIVSPNLRINDVPEASCRTDYRNLAVVGDNVYVVWGDDRTSVENIYFSRSTDGGETFSSDILLSTTNDENLNMWSSIATNSSGSIFVVWTGFTEPFMGQGSGVNVYFTKSTDEGESFDPPVKLTNDNLSIFPKVAAHEDYVYIMFANVSNMPYIDFFFTRSTDGGDNFTEAVQINEEPMVDDDAYFENFITVDPITGNLFLTWIDGRRENSGGDIYMAKSVDNGETLGNNVLVNDIEAEWADYEMLNPRITTAEENMVYVTFFVEGENEGDGRIFIATSNNGGDSFMTETILAENDNYSYYYDAMGLPNGNIGAVMSTNLHGLENALWFVRPDEMPIVINDAYSYWRSPSLVLTEQGETHFVWTDDREEDGNYNVYYAKVTECMPFEIPYHENFNEVATPLLPFCYVGLGYGTFNVSTEDFNTYAPPHSLNLYHDDESFALVAFPEFIDDISELEIRFMAYWHGGSTNLKVGVLTDVNDLNSFEIIESIELPEVNDYFEYTVSFSEFSGEEGRIALKYGSETVDTWGGLFIDDVHIDEISTYISPNKFDKDDAATIFPNPSNGKFSIETENNINSIVVFDLKGKKVKEKLVNSSQDIVNLENLKPGVYFLQINTDESVITRSVYLLK